MSSIATFSRALVGGYFTVMVRRGGVIVDHERADNIVVDEGLNYILNSALAGNVGAGQSQITTWYVGLLKNYTPVAGSVMTNFGAVANEFVAYDELVRQTWTPNALSTAQSLTNSTSRATFTVDTNSSTVYGAFLTSSSTKNGTTGTALAGALFSTAKNLDDDDELLITYTFGAADDGV